MSSQRPRNQPMGARRTGIAVPVVVKRPVLAHGSVSEVAHTFIRALLRHRWCPRTVRFDGGAAPFLLRLSHAAT